MSGEKYNLTALTNGPAVESGVQQGATLIDYADALLGSDEAALDRTIARVVGQLGEAALVDAAAVVATFNMLDRIADSTGIPLDGIIDLMTIGARSEVGIDRFASSANTPRSGPLRRFMAAIMAAFLPLGLKMMKAARSVRREPTR